MRPLIAQWPLVTLSLLGRFYTNLRRVVFRMIEPNDSRHMHWPEFLNRYRLIVVTGATLSQFHDMARRYYTAHQDLFGQYRVVSPDQLISVLSQDDVGRGFYAIDTGNHMWDVSDHKDLELRLATKKSTLFVRAHSCTYNVDSPDRSCEIYVECKERTAHMSANDPTEFQFDYCKTIAP